jgi:hypothetical protein
VAEPNSNLHFIFPYLFMYFYISIYLFILLLLFLLLLLLLLFLLFVFLFILNLFCFIFDFCRTIQTAGSPLLHYPLPATSTSSTFQLPSFEFKFKAQTATNTIIINPCLSQFQNQTRESPQARASIQNQITAAPHSIFHHHLKTTLTRALFTHGLNQNPNTKTAPPAITINPTVRTISPLIQNPNHQLTTLPPLLLTQNFNHSTAAPIHHLWTPTTSSPPSPNHHLYRRTSCYLARAPPSQSPTRSSQPNSP